MATADLDQIQNHPESRVHAALHGNSVVHFPIYQIYIEPP